MLLELNRCQAEDEFVHNCFTDYAAYVGAGYAGKYFTCEYGDVFTEAGAGLDPQFLERFSGWLGIANDFPKDCRCKKQSSLPLSETIENYAEVSAALRGTPFEYCLDDERWYGGSRNVGPAATPTPAGLPRRGFLDRLLHQAPRSSR